MFCVISALEIWQLKEKFDSFLALYGVGLKATELYEVNLNLNRLSIVVNSGSLEAMAANSAEHAKKVRVLVHFYLTTEYGQSSAKQIHKEIFNVQFSTKNKREINIRFIVHASRILRQVNASGEASAFQLRECIRW